MAEKQEKEWREQQFVEEDVVDNQNISYAGLCQILEVGAFWRPLLLGPKVHIFLFKNG